MDMQKEREAFEAWFESRYDAHFMQFALDIDMYVDKHTQTCWEAWQAPKAQAVPAGFVLVKMDDLELLRDSALEIKYASLNNDSDRIFSDIEDIQLSIERLIEAQELSHD